jgi:hypothetical protein
MQKKKKKLPFDGFQYGVNAKKRIITGKFANSCVFGFYVELQFERNNCKFGLMLRDIMTN